MFLSVMYLNTFETFFYRDRPVVRTLSESINCDAMMHVREYFPNLEIYLTSCPKNLIDVTHSEVNTSLLDC